MHPRRPPAIKPRQRFILCNLCLGQSCLVLRVHKQFNTTDNTIFCALGQAPLQTSFQASCNQRGFDQFLNNWNRASTSSVEAVVFKAVVAIADVQPSVEACFNTVAMNTGMNGRILAMKIRLAMKMPLKVLARVIISQGEQVLLLLHSTPLITPA